MPELHLRERLPELKLPEMSRDDIAKTFGEARKELAEAQKELSKIDPSKFEMPDIDVTKEIRDVGKDLRDAGKHMAKNARSAAQDAGLVQRPSRLPFVIAGAVTLALVTWAIANSPSVKARLRLAAQQIQDRMADRRSDWDDDEAEPHAFDAAVPVPVQPSAYADSTADKNSPFAEPPSDVPDGFGKTNGKRTNTSDEPARA